MDYSPVEGLIHKYEMGSSVRDLDVLGALPVLCYREELMCPQARRERPDGTVEKKGLAQILEVSDYIRAHNAAVAANGGRHPETGREKLREILLSGGDPMVLPNNKLAAWFTALAEARSGGDPARHQGAGFLPRPLRQRLFGHDGPLPRHLPRRRVPADAPTSTTPTSCWSKTLGATTSRTATDSTSGTPAPSEPWRPLCPGGGSAWRTSRPSSEGSTTTPMRYASFSAP